MADVQERYWAGRSQAAENSASSSIQPPDPPEWTSSLVHGQGSGTGTIRLDGTLPGPSAIGTGTVKAAPMHRNNSSHWTASFGEDNGLALKPPELLHQYSGSGSGTLPLASKGSRDLKVGCRTHYIVHLNRYLPGIGSDCFV